MEWMEITKNMNLKMKYIYFYLSVIIFTIYIVGCSELNDDLPSASKVYTHGEGVYFPGSSDFHPYTIANADKGMYNCQECHAVDFSGGVTGIGCDECHLDIKVHHDKDSILSQSSNYFHGLYIRDNNWEMRTCQPCHGEYYAGGMVSPSCNDCHINQGGPENCATCHGSATSPAPPRDISGNTSITSRGVGAHQVHLQGGSVGKRLACTDCHKVPGDTYDEGHLDTELPAEVFMNGYLATLITNDPSTSEYDSTLALFVPEPNYNSSNLSCSNTYCHGYFKNGNLNNSVFWTDPTSARCGTCHGDPTRPTPEERPRPKTNSEGGSHPDITNCFACHGDVVDIDLNIIDPSKHIDGLLNLFGEDIKY